MTSCGWTTSLAARSGSRNVDLENSRKRQPRGSAAEDRPRLIVIADRYPPPKDPRTSINSASRAIRAWGFGHRFNHDLRLFDEVIEAPAGDRVTARVYDDRGLAISAGVSTIIEVIRVRHKGDRHDRRIGTAP
jgi:hypothetical protein